MLAYAIAAARNSGLFERIVVSTESAEIGKMATWYGAEYLARPPELASDTADLVDVSLHVLQTLAAEGFQPQALCQLMPNCPLRRGEDICNHFREFQDSKRKFQISVVPYRAVYPHWAVVQGEDGGRHGARIPRGRRSLQRVKGWSASTVEGRGPGCMAIRASAVLI